MEAELLTEYRIGLLKMTLHMDALLKNEGPWSPGRSVESPEMPNPCVKQRQWLLEIKKKGSHPTIARAFVLARSSVHASSASLASPRGLGKPSPDSQSFSGMLWNDDRVLM